MEEIRDDVERFGVVVFFCDIIEYGEREKKNGFFFVFACHELRERIQIFYQKQRESTNRCKSTDSY